MAAPISQLSYVVAVARSFADLGVSDSNIKDFRSGAQQFAGRLDNFDNYITQCLKSRLGGFAVQVPECHMNETWGRLEG